MSGLTAEELALPLRGRIEPDFAADLVSFDPARVGDRATFAEPRSRSAGVERVWVNGHLAFAGGELRHTRAGQVVKR